MNIFFKKKLFFLYFFIISLNCYSEDIDKKNNKILQIEQVNDINEFREKMLKMHSHGIKKKGVKIDSKTPMKIPIFLDIIKEDSSRE